MGRAKGVADETGGGVKKGKRITIEEVDEANEESKGEEPVAKTTKEEVVEVESKTCPPVVPAPLPPAVLKKKEEGNSFFKRGQYGDAVGCYTKCIQLLEKGNLHVVPRVHVYMCVYVILMYINMLYVFLVRLSVNPVLESSDHSQSLSIVLSNRAACHFKNGDCRGCINDATRSIELVPVNLKSFMRRAQAYETMEKLVIYCTNGRSVNTQFLFLLPPSPLSLPLPLSPSLPPSRYKEAYCDYQLALRIDSRVDQARLASSRYDKILEF